jgi:hypothetical protein
LRSVLSTNELLDAAADTLDEEAREISSVRRALLLAWTRGTLAQWKAGVLTTDQAVASLRACSPTRRHSPVR